MKKIVFVLFFSVWALGTQAQVVQSSVTSIIEEKTALKYRGWVEGGIGVDITDILRTHEVTTTHGVQLSSGTFVGAGIGYFGHKKQTALPLYLDARQFFGRHRDRGLFAGMRIGYNCSLKKDQVIDINSYWDSYDENWVSSKSSYTFKMKGLFVSPCIGVTVKWFDISLSYLLFRELFEYHYESSLFSSPHEDQDSSYKSCLQLRLGVNF